MNNKNTNETLESRILDLEHLLKEWMTANGKGAARKPYLTIDEAADFICKSKPTVYSLVAKGKIPFDKQGNRLYFQENDLRAWIEAGRHNSNVQLS